MAKLMNLEEILASKRPRQEQFVHFNLRALRLEIRCGNRSYSIDLERVSTPAQALDWLTQFFGKSWVEPELFYEVFDALNDACHGVFGRGIQGCLCPMGIAQSVDWSMGTVNHADHR